MTLTQFENKLKEVCQQTYELAAPKGVRRCIVWHRYGRSSCFGDDKNQFDAPRIQLDIVTQNPQDVLVDDVCAALWLMDLPYDVVSEGYDDEYAAMRTIIQLVVV